MASLAFYQTILSQRELFEPFKIMTHCTLLEMQDFTLWAKMKERGALLSFDLEITARCNNACRHCYINLPAADREARSKELTLQEISSIADQAVALGALWVLISGGEPLLREDFEEIYMLLKRKGLLVSVFTNATLIRDEHIVLFKKSNHLEPKAPKVPKDVEITVFYKADFLFITILKLNNLV